jgi:creatinine amidohydrolase/Fe(II)-dependent formamide hydrolase-like protein
MIDRRRCVVAAIACACGAPAAHAAADSVWLEELTSPELRARVAAGATTVLVPVGGTEQNGAHLTLGKHNVRARVLAERIARRLGDALVAPVIAYAPEGDIDPPTQHMRYAGTLSITPAAFESLLDGAARSLHRHGFRHVVLLGDHGGYQSSLQRVADRLNKQWHDATAAIALTEYYAAAQDFSRTLAARGYSGGEIGQHAGLADTALAWAVDASLVRAGALRPSEGVSGDPRRADADLGRDGIEHIVATSVAAIRARIAGASKKH